MKRANTLSALACLAGAAVTIALGWRYFRPMFVDDSYIYFRYAENARDGFGIVWNAGDRPVEGFTSLLWVLVLVLARYVTPGIETAARAAGLLFALLTLAASAALYVRLARPSAKEWFGLPVLALAFSPVFPFHAVNGMETMMTAFLALVVCLIATSGADARTSPRLALSLAALTVLIALARPDALLVGLAAMVARLLSAPEGSWKSRLTAPPARAYLAGLVVLGGLYLLWKQVYFGRILPLPMYVKLGFSRPIYTDPHLIYAVWGHFLTMITYAALPMGLILVYLALGDIGWRYRVSLAAATVYGLYFLSVLPIVSPEWRYYFPSVVLWIVLAATALVNLTGDGRRVTDSESVRPPSSVPRQPISWILLSALLVFCNIGRLNRVRDDQTLMYAAYRPMGELGRALSSLAPQHALAAVTEAGQFPYFSRWRIFDVYGLNDAFVATHRFKQPAYLREHFWEYTRSHYGLPDLVTPLNLECDYALPERNPHIAPLYEPVELHKLGLRVEVRKDSPLRGEIMRVIAQYM